MSVLKQKSSISLPENATVTGKSVVWFDKKGRKHSGKLTKTGRVLIESEFWQIRYRDENGKERREPSGVKNKEAAISILLQREKEVERIKMGIATRQETIVAGRGRESLDKQLQLFKNILVASGCGDNHVKNSISRIKTITKFCGFESVGDITAEGVTNWLVNEVGIKKRTPATVNQYILIIKRLCKWATKNNRLLESPIEDIQPLKGEGGTKKKRRSLTEDELLKLFETVKKSKRRTKHPSEERELIYRLLVGTGIRSNELSKARLAQFNFNLNRFEVDPAVTKNRKSGYLPIRVDLLNRIKEYCNKHHIGQRDVIFGYKIKTLLSSFYLDIEDAGIERVTPDGRCIDVHSLRRTFGTMLARAGVPLTTTQRLMRHSSPELTARLYIDVEPIDMSNAVDKLPVFE